VVPLIPIKYIEKINYWFSRETKIELSKMVRIIHKESPAILCLPKTKNSESPAIFYLQKKKNNETLFAYGKLKRGYLHKIEAQINSYEFNISASDD